MRSQFIPFYARPTESRDVVVACLGKELGVEAWLGNWNRMRKQGDTPNKIEVIELRSDPKYGKFFAHKPATARVEVRRVKDQAGDKLVVEVKDFLSPSILERLQEQAGPLLAPKITDWRATVDSVMIDPAYDGQVFNIALADVPERKPDFVQATYELPAPAAKTTVAVKVTDMLGEEVLVQKEVLASARVLRRRLKLRREILHAHARLAQQVAQRAAGNWRVHRPRSATPRTHPRR